MNTLKYNENDYILKEEDFLQLDKDRPLGLSGHLRVINGELTLRECIDSCLPFLDELIITYQPSKDKTEEIINDYAQRFPKKVKVFCYKPFIVSSSLRSAEWGTEEEKSRNSDLQYRKSNSIHNSANYYNYGYTKINYRYYMKIDADQIYFTDKMKQIRRALLFPLFSSSKFMQLFFKIYCKINTKFDLQSFIFKYFSYFVYTIFLRVLHFDKPLALFLGGIEAHLYNGKIGFSTEQHHDPFNGFVGDTFIWIPNSNARYFQVKDRRSQNITCSGLHIPIGFAWIHTVHILKHLDKYEREKKLILHTSDNIKTFTELSHIPYLKIQDLLINKHDDLKEIRLAQVSQFWNKDRRYFSQKDFLVSIEQNLQNIRY